MRCANLHTEVEESWCDNGGVALRPSDARVRLRISNIAGRVEVVADDGATDVVVTGGTQVVDHDDRVVDVQPNHPSQAIHVRCPPGTDVMVGTTSGAVKLQGSLGSVSVSSASGRIRVATAAEVDLRTGSGRIEVDACTGRCRASTKSGAVVVGSANAAEITTVSGKVRLGLVAGTIDVRTVSGSVDAVVDRCGPDQRSHALRLRLDQPSRGCAPGGARVGRPLGGVPLRGG